MQAAGNDEPIPFNRSGDAGCIGLSRAQISQIFGGLLRSFGEAVFIRHSTEPEVLSNGYAPLLIGPIRSGKPHRAARGVE